MSLDQQLIQHFNTMARIRMSEAEILKECNGKIKPEMLVDYFELRTQARVYLEVVAYVKENTNS